MEVDDGEGGQKQTVRLVKGPITGNGDEECDARLQGEGVKEEEREGGREGGNIEQNRNALDDYFHSCVQSNL